MFYIKLYDQFLLVSQGVEQVLRGVFLQMVGILRFVRRWMVIGRVIRQVFPQICGVVFLLLLLLLLFSHTGIMVQCFLFI